MILLLIDLIAILLIDLIALLSKLCLYVPNPIHEIRQLWGHSQKNHFIIVTLPSIKFLQICKDFAVKKNTLKILQTLQKTIQIEHTSCGLSYCAMSAETMRINLKVSS